MHGWYSEKAAEVCGSIFYETPEGREVKVTGVTFDEEGKGYKWSDRVYIGPVEKYLRGNMKSHGY